MKNHPTLSPSHRTSNSRQLISCNPVLMRLESLTNALLLLETPTMLRSNLDVLCRRAHQFPCPCASRTVSSFFANPTRPYSRSTVIHPLRRQPVTMSNHHIYAFNNLNPQWDLSTSEEREAVERTIQALRENASAIGEEFRKDLDVYWVIM